MSHRLLIAHTFRECLDLLQCRGLRLQHQGNIFGKRFAGLRRRFSANDCPGRVHDLLLQVAELGRTGGAASTHLLLSLLTRRAPRRLLALTKDFLEVPHFGEEHIARRASTRAIRGGILSPKVICQQLVGFRVEFLERDQMRHLGPRLA